MEFKTVYDPAFAPYGRIVQGLDCSELLDTLRRTTDKPADRVIYVPSCGALEALPAAKVLSDSVYGGMPVQIGYCNGTNTKLNCLEYHRDSEVNIVGDEIVFLVARQQDIQGGQLSTAKVEAFRAPAGTAVEFYATTLHYAPCDGARGAGFRVAVILPRGTNTEKPVLEVRRAEDTLLWARNKWLLAHADTDEAKQGAFVGLLGQNIDILTDL